MRLHGPAFLHLLHEMSGESNNLVPKTRELAKSINKLLIKKLKYYNQILKTSWCCCCRRDWRGSIKQNQSKLEISFIPRAKSISRVSKSIIHHHQPITSIRYGILYDSNTAYYHHNLFQHFHANANDGATESAATGGLNVMPPTSAVEFFLWPNQSYWL